MKKIIILQLFWTFFPFIHIFSSSISECVSNITVTATGKYVGGIVGISMSSIIENSYNKGVVSASDNVGGIVGLAYHPDDIFEFNPISGEILAVKERYKTFSFLYIPRTIKGVTVRKILDQTLSPDPTIGNIRGNLNIVEVYIAGNSFTSLGQYAFSDCENLKKISFPKSSLLEIGNHCFQSCKALQGTLYIPNSVTHLGELAFSYCIEISEIHISTGLDIIPNSFFACCGLKKIYLPKNTMQLIGVENMFQTVHDEFKIYVPFKLLDDYKTSKNWSVYSSRFTTF